MKSSLGCTNGIRVRGQMVRFYVIARTRMLVVGLVVLLLALRYTTIVKLCIYPLANWATHYSYRAFGPLLEKHNVKTVFSMVHGFIGLTIKEIA